MGILLRVEEHIVNLLTEYKKEKKVKLPTNIETRWEFLPKKNCWTLNLPGKLNRDIRLFIRKSEKWSKRVLDMGDRFGFECCTHAVLARDAFCKRYPGAKLYEGEPFFIGTFNLWVVEVADDIERELFNEFLRSEYHYPCKPKKIVLKD